MSTCVRRARRRSTITRMSSADRAKTLTSAGAMAGHFGSTLDLVSRAGSTRRIDVGKKRSPDRAWQAKEDRMNTPRKRFAANAASGSGEARAFNARLSRMMDELGSTMPLDLTSTDLEALHALIARVENRTGSSDDVLAGLLMVGAPPPQGMLIPTAEDLSREDRILLLTRMRQTLSEWLEAARSSSKMSRYRTPNSPDYSEIEKRLLGDLAKSAGTPEGTPHSAQDANQRAYYLQNLKDAFDKMSEETKRQMGIDMAFDKSRRGPGWEYFAPADEWRAIPPGQDGHVPESWYDEHHANKGALPDDEKPLQPGRTYLFVGGAGAGRRIAVPKEYPAFRATEEMDYLPRPSPDMGMMGNAIEEDTYRRMEISVGDVTMEVMACVRLSPAEVAQELLKQYRPHSVDDCGECRSRIQYERMKK